MTLFKSPRAYVIFAVIGLISGAIAGHFLCYYQGEIYFRPGRIASFTTPDMLRPIVTPDLVVTELKQAVFYTKELRELCDLGNPETPYHVSRRVWIKEIRGSDQIILGVVHSDKSKIKPCLDAVFQKYQAKERAKIDRIEAPLTAELRRLEAFEQKPLVISGSPTVALVGGRAAELQVKERLLLLRDYLDSRAERIPHVVRYVAPDVLHPWWWAWPMIGAVVGLMVGWVATRFEEKSPINVPAL